MLIDCARNPIHVGEGCGAEVDPANSRIQRAVEACLVADTAGELNVEFAAKCIDDSANQLGVVAPAERGVKIDEVEPLGALHNKALGNFEWVTKQLFAIRRSPGEAHRLPVGDIDGGKQDECGHGLFTGLQRAQPVSQ